MTPQINIASVGDVLSKPKQTEPKWNGTRDMTFEVSSDILNRPKIEIKFFLRTSNYCTGIPRNPRLDQKAPKLFSKPDLIRTKSTNNSHTFWISMYGRS